MKTISNFKLLQTIDKHGATCKVKKAVSLKSKQEVAIKLIDKNLAETMKESFNIEINALKKLNHENVIRIVDHDTVPYKGHQREFIALELA